MKSPPNFSNLNAYRVAIACDQRCAQAWMMAGKGQTLREIGDRFKVSRERARQLVARAARVLNEWPAANDWQASLPLRLRELCVFHRIETANALVVILAGNVGKMRGWRSEDVELARELFELPPLDDAPLAALDRVLDFLRHHDADVHLLQDAGIVGAAAFAFAGDLLARYGADVYKAGRLDDAKIAAAGMAPAQPSTGDAQGDAQEAPP